MGQDPRVTRPPAAQSSLVSRPRDISSGELAMLIPSNSLSAWADTNGVLSSVAAGAEGTVITLKAPAAGRDLPTTGASWVTPLTNLRGSAITSLQPHALRYPLLKWATATAISADCWVGIVLINASTVAGATVGYGLIVGGNGTGTTQGRTAYTAGWLAANAGAYDASGRGAVQLIRFATAAGGHSSSTLIDASNAIVGSHFADGTTRTLGPMTHVALCCGWLAGTGSIGATISVKPYLAVGNPLSLPGVT